MKKLTPFKVKIQINNQLHEFNIISQPIAKVIFYRGVKHAIVSALKRATIE